MVKQVYESLRETTEQLATRTPALGELAVDTDKDVVVVGDGETKGGIPSAREDRAFTLDGDTIYYPDSYTGWDDLRFPFTQAKRGSNLKPDFDEDNVGLLFPQNNANEKIFIIGQLPHEYKYGTDIHVHVHWLQEQAAFPTWVFEYKVIEIGSAPPALFTQTTANDGAITYTSGSIHQLTELATIDGSAIDSVSAIVLMRFWRDDNDVTGDVTAWELDFHYQYDSVGSGTEYAK